MSPRRVRKQAATRSSSVSAIMRDADFAAGVDDVRAGRYARFDEFNSWEYERGRQFAMLVPISMPLRVKGKLNPKALTLLENAFARKEIR
jgi:hypothetical protein